MEANQTEFVRLLATYSSSLYGYVLTLVGDRSAADDIYQNTCVVLWEKYATFTPGTNFIAWACRVAQYQVMAERRKNKHVLWMSDSTVEALAEDALAIVELPDNREEALASCLEKLSSRDRQLVEDRYFSQLSIASMATRCSRSQDSIYRALARVHRLLLRCVQHKLADR